MKKIVKLTESDLVRLVKRIINEQGSQSPLIDYIKKNGFTQFTPTDIREKYKSEHWAERLGLTQSLSFKNKSGAFIITDGSFVVFIDPWERTQKFSLNDIQKNNMLKDLRPLGSDEMLRSLVKRPQN